MRISQRMQVKQSQKLHMSPQLQQSILVLQMNNLELAELLQAEAEKIRFLKLVRVTSGSFRGKKPMRR